MGLPLFPAEGVAVFDTSSVISIRQLVTRTDRPAVLNQLRGRVRAGRLVFPSDVVRELERYVSPAGAEADPLLEWARSCQIIATANTVSLELVKTVLARVPLVVDSDKPTDEADPYVLALAITVRDQGGSVVVVTDDRRDKPDKTSLATACGIFRVPTLPLLPFLSDEGIWKPG